mmetsp:Transcript_5726/g.12557  ORF Transcript_5726/g.12557 Transcript_5726/m.12557 type:complete len:471 (+) Transcript_5726:204-1616(+)
MPTENTTDTNLCSSANGAHILFATDEWFAAAENLLNPYPPTFVPDLYCEQGKVMDGWETRRKRMAGHDWCIIQLGSSGDVDCSTKEAAAYFLNSILVDTAYFTGNQAPRISIEAIKLERPYGSSNNDYFFNWMPGAVSRIVRGGGIRGTGETESSIQAASDACKKLGQWITVLPTTPLKPGYEESRHHFFTISNEISELLQEMGGVTHLKLNYFPDGGVARLKVFGKKLPIIADSSSQDIIMPITNPSTGPNIHPHSSTSPSNQLPSSLPYPHPEISSDVRGGIGIACSNKHYGVPSNLLRPTLGKDMGDGWETARHPNRPLIVRKDPVTGLQETPLMDWSTLKLGLGGASEEGISRIIVDTRHFKGNFPESVRIDGCCANPAFVTDDEVCASADTVYDSSHVSKVEWFPLLNRVALTADAEHEFLRENGLIENGRRAVTHIRVSIFPDGGLSRVRVYAPPAMGNGRSHL